MSQYVNETVEFIEHMQECERGKPFEKPDDVMLSAKERGEQAAKTFILESSHEKPTVGEIIDRIDSSALPYNPRRKSIELDRYVSPENLALACLALETDSSPIYRGAASHHPETIECIEEVLSTLKS